ncbi:MAG TPA: cyclic nucleotide-binding and patatin-like phospholipase domain-containing protein [Pirellulales bacterium]|nr:cyclic nucleotide-binding and patatin-like phospholipase domain-containing protein [Pirellulales bacterium]
MASSGTSLERARQVLLRCALCRGLDDLAIEHVAAATHEVTAPADHEVFRQGDPGDSVYIVASGQIQLQIEPADGPPRVLDSLRRGDHFGDMGALTRQPRAITALAVIDSLLLRIDLDTFDELLVRVPGLAANLSRTLVWRLHHENTRARRRRHRSVIGLVNTVAATRRLVPLLAAALVARGDSVEVITDRDETWPTQGAYVVERLKLESADAVASLRTRLHELSERHVRVLLDLSPSESCDRLVEKLTACEEIWWLVDRRESAAAFHELRRILAAAPSLAPRSTVVWLLGEDQQFAPLLPTDVPLGRASFKVRLGDGPTRSSLALERGLGRLVRHVRGTRLGLALGGGGARGLAHLGAIRAFQRAGIDFDMLAGTSSGALMGLSYAADWSPDRALGEFKAALTPGFWWRMLPGASQWFLLAKFRRLAWEAMLRKYAEHTTIEQLPVPFATVAVDLVRGIQVVRDRGDAIHAVLESINLPLVARPILRDGMALIDGGVLNNVPGDVLAERGADLIVGIDVVARVLPTFAGNTPDTPTAQMKQPGLPASVLRIVEVQAHDLSVLRSNAVDLTIAPDASAIDFTDFSRADELADIGEAAAEEAIPRLKELLAELERHEDR